MTGWWARRISRNASRVGLCDPRGQVAQRGMGLDGATNDRRTFFCRSKPRAQPGTKETPSPRILEQAIRHFGSLGIVRNICHDHNHHSVYAGWLECLGRRVSRDAGQRCLSYEGSSPLCCFILSVEAGCRKIVAFDGFRQELLDIPEDLELA